ncbi:MAG TPA: hypothetical protein VJ965_00615 [Anaerolineales bacterium]|nr:hypothetical protein [Anaerolineales bacterium]
MDLLTKENLSQLLEHKANPAISVFLPMARAGDATLKNPIRYKNARKRIESLLQDEGYDAQVTENIITQFAALAEGNDFFQNQLEGLAVFLSSDYQKLVQLPYRFDEWVQVGETFELRPLLQAYQDGIDFYIISLSREQSRLFRASKFNILEIELAQDVPTSFEEAMKYDAPEDQLQQNTITSSDGGRTQIFHGHTESDQEKKNLRRFFQQLDRGIRAQIDDHNLPVLLVGLDYLHPLYKAGSDIPHILETGLDKNPDDLPIQDLHRLAWQIVESSLQSDVAQAINRYQESLGSDKSTAVLSEIPLAAAYGKVDTLLVEKHSQIWGQVSPEENKLEVEEEGDTDLLSYSVKQTLLHGGEVYVFDEEEMPSEKADVLAVLRY